MYALQSLVCGYNILKFVAFRAVPFQYRFYLYSYRTDKEMIDISDSGVQGSYLEYHSEIRLSRGYFQRIDPRLP